MGMWNSSVNWDTMTEDDLEEMRRRAAFGTNPGIDNAMPNTPAANPSLRRMASQGGFIGSDDAPKTAPYQVPERYTKNIERDEYAPMPTGFEREVDESAASGLSVPREKPLTGSRASLAELEDARALPADVHKAKKRGKFSRFWRGAGDAWDNWSGKGGLFGLVGEMIDQGASEARKPSERAERVKRQGLSKMFGRYGEDMQIESAEQKRQQESIKTAADLNKYRIDAGKPTMDALAADDYFSEQDSADYMARTGFYIPPYDKREFDLVWNNGVPRITPKKGGKGQYVRAPGLTDQIENVPRDTTIDTPSGKVTLPLKPGQAANTLVQAQVRAERAAEMVQKREDDQKEKVYKSRTEFQDDLRKWSADDVKMQGQKAKATKAKAAMEEALNDPQNQAFTGDIRKSIAAFEGDIAEADVWIANRDKTKPKYTPHPGEGKRSKGGKQKFKMSDIDRVIQGK